MTPELLKIIAAILGVVALIAGLVWWWMNRTPHVQRNESGVLPLFGGVTEGGSADPDIGVMEGGTVRLQSPYVTPSTSSPAVGPASSVSVPSRPAHSSPARHGADVATPSASPLADMPTGVPRVPAKTEPVRRPQAAAPTEERKASSSVIEFVTGGPSPRGAGSAAGHTDATVVSAEGVPGTMVEGHLLRFSVPAEGTLQFLPGRLEIASGLDTGREIRFVRVPGPHEMEVTFGRSEGELYRHIQLRDQTVSRSHARMCLVDGRWSLMNFSQTNPVVHNGRVLADGVDQPLEDGDRIEMGEVLFTFKSR